jgi:predicted esterase
MNSEEKEISYQTTNSYATLNHLTEHTKTVWLVFHGMGYLSRYFLKYFDELNPGENYIIAPQAPSKYYIPPTFKHVGASWLTKENTLKETENILRYIDAILETEQIPKNKKLIVLGYSQGVSIATRYVVKRQLSCEQLVLMSGGIPKELVADDFSFLNKNSKVSLIYGTQDEYLDVDQMTYEKNRAFELFGNRLTITAFDGKHEVKKDIIHNLTV